MKLEVRDLRKSFGGNEVLHGISFSVESGNALGLLGRNGAGKTTTIRILMNVFKGNAGAVLLDGKPFDPAKHQIGYMPEERGLYPKKTVSEQLIYLGMLRGLSAKKAKENMKKWLAKMEVSEYENRKLETLSKGNQQKVQLAATLIHDPELIFLDEPFSGLDPVNAEVLRNLILELVEEKKYIVLSSHQMTTVEEYCRDILILHHGKTLLEGNLSKIKSGCGRTNLIIKPEDKDRAAFEQILENVGLKLIEKRAYEYEYRINGEDEAVKVLKAMLAQNIYPLKYDVKEPSLQEIFVRSVETSERGNEQ